MSGSTSDVSSCTMEEIEIPVPWGIIAGRISGPVDGKPLLLLHGWMNNCGTFNGLQQLLPRHFRCLALDFPGHGRSSALPDGAFYLQLQHATCVRQVCQQLSWHQVSLLAHSMGGAVALFYAALFPDQVDSLVLLDMPKPVTPAADSCCDWSRQAALDTVAHWGAAAPRHVPRPWHQLRDRLRAVIGGLSDDTADKLLERGVVHDQETGLYRWSHDIRLRHRSLVPITVDTFLGYAERMRCRLLLINAESGVVQTKNAAHDQHSLSRCYDTYRRVCRQFQLELVAGGHFVHLTHPHTVAPLVNTFLCQQCTGESTGGRSSL